MTPPIWPGMNVSIRREVPSYEVSCKQAQLLRAHECHSCPIQHLAALLPIFWLLFRLFLEPWLPGEAKQTVSVSALQLAVRLSVDWWPQQNEAFPPLLGSAQVYMDECKCFFCNLTIWPLSKIRMARSVLGPATSIVNDFRPDPRRIVWFLLLFQTMSKSHFTPSSRIRTRACNWQVPSE